MTPFPLRIASAQSVISTDVRRNGQGIRALMREASVAGARLVHFPEGALSGYAKSQIKDWSTVDWHAVREELEKIAAYAAELRIWTVVGSAHHLTPPHRPLGAYLAQAPITGQSGLAIGHLDRDDPDWADHLAFARPWRSAARAGDIYTVRRVRDTRSDNRTSF